MADEITPSPTDIERVGRFLDGISRGVITELSQLLGQQIAYWRFKNALTIAVRAQKFLESKGLVVQQLSAELRTIVPLLEYASYEDEPSLQQMWASLFAASVSPEFNSSMHPKYSEVLRQISPLEARLLHDMYEFNRNSGFWIYADLSNTEQIIGSPIKELQESFINLERLKLIAATFGNAEDGYYINMVIITPFLANLMERCTYVKD